MSDKSSILIFVLFSGYPSINVVRGNNYPHDHSVYEAATTLISSTKPPTISGTKWCGYDTLAETNSDLGHAAETDKCCREWHQCEDILAPKETKYGLRNQANYRILLCSCTDKFHHCLKNVNGIESVTAHLVGLAYFDAINPTCLKKMYYSPTCTPFFYDAHGTRHSDNYQNEHNYFCPRLVSTQYW